MESITYHSFIVYVHDQGQARQNEFKIGARFEANYYTWKLSKRSEPNV